MLADSDDEDNPDGVGEMGVGTMQQLHSFSLSELRGATANFSPLLMVGMGGFGCVYRGALCLPGGNPHGTAVAVKKLNPNGGQVPKLRCNSISIVFYCLRNHYYTI